MNEFEAVAIQIKKIVAMGDYYIEELNRELLNCNIAITHNSARKNNLDYDDPQNSKGGVQDD